MRGQSSAELIFDPEIEKTAKAHRKAARERRQRERHLVVEEEVLGDCVIFTEMADPPPPERTLGEYGNRIRNHARLPIHHQPVTINKFEISPALYQELREIHFAGRHNEDANRHLPNFFELCETVKVDGLSEESKKLKLFPFSLIDDAKEWFLSFPADSITTWDDLEDKFLEQYFPPAMFVRKRQEITGYKQKEGESLRDTYRRFRNLLAGCPNHAYDDTAQMKIFCNGLRPSTRIMLDATAGGSVAVL